MKKFAALNPRLKLAQGFSLIELLISLIVISVIIASFAPVVTKKLKYQNATYSAVKAVKIDCSGYDTEHGSCLLCSETECSLCSSSISVPDGYFVNPNQTCNRQSCTLLDPKCKRCTKDGCQECISGYKIKPDKSCELATCNKGFYLTGSSCNSCGAGTFQANDNSTATSCSACSSAHANCSTCDTATGCCSVCSGEWVASSCACVAPNCGDGKYWNGSNCTPCTNPCANCSGSASSCTSCIGGFQLNGTTCTALFDSKTFNYTGGVQTWTVPYTGTFKLEVWGAQGGNAQDRWMGVPLGGYGGYAQGKKALTAGQTLYIYVGGMGGNYNGGFNGGGTAKSVYDDDEDSEWYGQFYGEGSGGGGATDIRIGGTDWANRVIVAGGGGGSSCCGSGGSGGGAAGGNGTSGTPGDGEGATQSSGSYLGVGCSTAQEWNGAAGGGGYWGGKCGGNWNGSRGGGGGSGYIGGVTQGSMSNGVRSGHGVAVISKT